MNKKIIVISDFDSNGSGYRSICVPLLTKLSEMGYEIKVAGMMYRGDEHNFPFSIIPAQNLQEASGIVSNLMQLWNPDILLVALDLPIQGSIYNQFAPLGKKYIAITPMENGPLCMTWAVPLFNMDKVFFISELGKQEAQKVGLTNVEHLQIGVDTVSWRPPVDNERKQLRDGLDIPKDAFVVLTVADNQERKNLWAGLEAIRLFKEESTHPIRYILVTREHNPYGWKLRDLVTEMKLQNEVMIFERGLPQKDLWGLYAISDAYLQPSKAEGLGLPVLDAMACSVPVVATDTGALHELLENGRGVLVSPDYIFRDVWGNSIRAMISTKGIVNGLHLLQNVDIEGKVIGNKIVNKAYDYVYEKNWNIPAKQFDVAVRKMFNE